MAREQRERLEETVESLARQHMSLEKAMTKSKRNLSDIKQGESQRYHDYSVTQHVTMVTVLHNTGRYISSDRPPGEGVVGIFDSDEDDEDFYDAMDNSTDSNNGSSVLVPSSPKLEEEPVVQEADRSSISLKVSFILDHWLLVRRTNVCRGFAGLRRKLVEVFARKITPAKIFLCHERI